MLPKPSRRGAAGALLARAAACAAPAHAADSYPNHPITVVVPQTAGGAADSVARVLTQVMAENLGQPLIVENRVGAGGVIGTRYVQRAPNDGYTLLFSSTSHAINAALRKNAGYDAVTDFEPIALVAQGPFVLVANPDFQAKTVPELIALAKQKPGSINFGSVGVGSFNHLLGEMLQADAGIKLTHIAYRGDADASSAVVGGQVPISFNSLAGALPLIKAGKLRALGVSTAQPSPLLPDVPPIGKFVQGYEGTSWYGVFAPRGTPKAVVEKISRAVGAALKDPAVVDRLGLAGATATYEDAPQFTQFLRSQMTLWNGVIEHAGVTVDN
jgi:tripartite-type tricarboxylate transporter receptor subunit TctC